MSWTQRIRQKKTRTSTEVGLEHGFRSGLEDLNARLLLDNGVQVTYEEHKLKYSQPSKERTYTPDFILPNGIVIETKGRFITSDRQKHLHIKASWPDLEIRFVFSNARSKISKRSLTTYAAWCEHKGFLWADSTIPLEWLKEPLTKRWVQSAEEALGWTPPKGKRK